LLNRLYIVIGVLAILVLAGGFLVPQFIDWGNYRERIADLAETNLGADVTIDGEIDFTLLPQPRMVFGRTVVGPREDPFVEIEEMVADFSLMDFLRDRFVITDLEVRDPTVHLVVNDEGRFDLPLDLPETFGASNVSVASAGITGGAFEFSDERTDERWRLQGFDGQLRISGMTGPFSLQGTGEFDGSPYRLRVSTAALAEDGRMQLSYAVRPADEAFSLTGEGFLEVGARPNFEGQFLYRVTPDAAADVDEVRGDFVVTSEMQLNAQRLLLSAFSVMPDENQAGTRLSGAAELELGAERRFEAVLSGGVIAPARQDAAEEEMRGPYEIIRLLEDMPAPPVPPIAGRIGVDITELGLRGFSLRNVRLDAVTQGERWELETFTGELPGSTTLDLAGTVGTTDGALTYDGDIRIEANRLDMLAQMWRRPGDDNPLFNMSGELAADVTLNGSELGLANGELTLDGTTHEFASLFEIGDTRSALLSARLGELDEEQSRAILALLPDFRGDPAFSASFPSGSVDVAAERATVLDIPGEGLAARFDWGEGELQVERFSARDWGGARFNLTGQVGGTLAQPVVSGGGSLRLGFDDDRFSEMLLERAGTSEQFREWLLRSLPLDVQVDLSPANEKGEQVLSMNGAMGVAEVQASANLAGGLRRALDGPLVVEANLSAADGDAFADQLGLGVSPLSSGEPVAVSVQAGGTASNSLQTTVSATAGDERLAYAGTLIVSDPMRIQGNGQFDFALDDPGPALALLGVDALSLSEASGTASAVFTGNQSIALNDLVVRQDGRVQLSGNLNFANSGGERLLTGQVDLERLELPGLWATIAGQTSLIEGDGAWPDGPIDLSPDARTTRGRIDVTAPWLTLGERALFSDVSMVVSWDDQTTRIQNFSAQSTGGSVEASLDLCCAGVASEKQASGRVSLDNVALATFLPEGAASAVSGTLDGGVNLDATGASLLELAQALSGEGSFTVSDLSVAHFDPEAFDALSEVEDITELEAADLSRIVAGALEGGPFNAEEMSGVFRMAAGSVRADNLAAEGRRARMLGNISVDLSTFALGGEFTLSPTEVDDPDGIITANNAQVTANLTGTVPEPDRELDVAQMVDAIQVRALQQEVERLERLREEQEARARESAEARARQMEAEAERQREEAERQLREQIARDQAERQAAGSGGAEETEGSGQQLEQPFVFDFESRDPLVTQDPFLDPNSPLY